MVIKEQKHRHVSEDEFIRAEQKRSKETQKHEHLSLYFNLITHYVTFTATNSTTNKSQNHFKRSAAVQIKLQSTSSQLG